MKLKSVHGKRLTVKREAAQTVAPGCHQDDFDHGQGYTHEEKQQKIHEGLGVQGLRRIDTKMIQLLSKQKQENNYDKP